MATEFELKAAVDAAQKVLTEAEAALFAWGALAENNLFTELDKALSTVEDKLLSLAHDHCEGAGNCGLNEYMQEFMVSGVRYRGTLKVEYNRHDKTYYYIEESEFTHEAIG